MPPRIPVKMGFKPALPVVRALSSTVQPKNPRGTRNNTATNLLSLDEAPKRSSPQKARARTSTEEIQRLISRTDERYSRIKSQRADIQQRLEAQRISDEYLAQMPRHWREGDVFTPHDLSGNEMKKWRRNAPKTVDVFDVTGVNPLDHYRVSFSSYAPVPKTWCDWSRQCVADSLGVELYLDFRLYFEYGPDSTLKSDWPPTSKPTQDRQSYPKGNGYGSSS
ncbi:hypothetical protein SAPIO_CDS8641 [Scedosporium apiospermum]|uniref:Uncharacterized protein n=1 Tax=Pseudallescheria apiosperma TaxID=563466 RepID=A0A084G041_PSEDA|nr:uncharacterized protein SAPIO_CDS8641 [Scedosporium apiospermum]KEZ40703.1 hypothetical protein SAPIO_CDS8641 [Scedosporium apiospermum]